MLSWYLLKIKFIKQHKISQFYRLKTIPTIFYTMKP